MTHVDYDAACKLDDSLPNATNNMTDSGNKPTVQCPPFAIFHTTIGISPANARSKTDVISIKCNVGEATLVCEFYLQAADKLESNG